tara:strand:+ start:260 stop:655 length:396 start_codon:yes stop_codon:yes gene_type:complete
MPSHPRIRSPCVPRPATYHLPNFVVFPAPRSYVNVSMVAAYWGFLVVCPLLRALTLLLLLLPRSLPRARAVQIYRVSRYASYFYAYEVRCYLRPSPPSCTIPHLAFFRTPSQDRNPHPHPQPTPTPVLLPA